VDAVLAGLAVYAGGSEVLQSTLPIHRDGDVADAAVDLVGVAIGALVGRRPR
jgi:VanZ family protein